MRRDPKTYQWAVDGPPVGVWRTAQGSFDNVSIAELTLRPDGTGLEEHFGSMLEGQPLSLLWRWERPGELRIFPIFEDGERPERDSDWDVFRYRADWRVFDIGEGPILINEGRRPDDVLIPAGGFWNLFAPVWLVGRP